MASPHLDLSPPSMTKACPGSLPGWTGKWQRKLSPHPFPAITEKNPSKEETGAKGDHGYDGVTDAADDPAVCEEGEQPALLEKTEEDCESHSRGPAGQESVQTSWAAHAGCAHGRK